MTYRSPLLARPGAVVGLDPDAGVAAHYGEPVREQRALAGGTAVVDLSHLGVVTVAGPDRLSWLHSLSTQALVGLAPGEPREALVLDPHGHVEHAAAVVDDGERAWLVTEAAAAPRLAAFLHDMRFMLRVEVAEVTGTHAVLGASLAALERVVAAAPGALLWRDPWPTVGEGGASYGPADAHHPGMEHRVALVIVPRGDLAAVVARVEAGGGSVAGTGAWEALRVAAWRPRLAREVDERTIPHELDWLRTAVHLHKGCYRGQETVARVVNLGRPPRRLVMLHLDGSEHVLPPAGAAVLDGAREVGRVTSVARHHEAGPIALAVVRRSVPADAALTVAMAAPDGAPSGERAHGAIAAAQEVIVRPDGWSDARPAERGDLPPVRSLTRRRPD